MRTRQPGTTDQDRTSAGKPSVRYWVGRMTGNPEVEPRRARRATSRLVGSFATIGTGKRPSAHESRLLALCAQCNAQQFTSLEEAHARSPGSGAPADDGGHVVYTITPRQYREGELHDICERPDLPFVGVA